MQTTIALSIDEMASRWNGKSMKWQVDKMASQRNGKSTKWQVNEMASQRNGKSTKWQVDEMTRQKNGLTCLSSTNDRWMLAKSERESLLFVFPVEKNIARWDHFILIDRVFLLFMDHSAFFFTSNEVFKDVLAIWIISVLSGLLRVF